MDFRLLGGCAQLEKSNDWHSMVIVIDEIQKIANWSEVVKKGWDSDTFNDIDIKALLLGSSRVLLEKGLSESLAGRFEEIRMSHWSYSEMRDCFGLSLNKMLGSLNKMRVIPLLFQGTLICLVIVVCCAVCKNTALT